MATRERLQPRHIVSGDAHPRVAVAPRGLTQQLLQIQDGCPARRHNFNAVPLGEQQGRLGILQQAGIAFRGMMRIQRHVGRARFQNTQQSCYQRGGSIQADGYAVATPYTPGNERVRDAVRCSLFGSARRRCRLP